MPEPTEPDDWLRWFDLTETFVERRMRLEVEREFLQMEIRKLERQIMGYRRPAELNDPDRHNA